MSDTTRERGEALLKEGRYAEAADALRAAVGEDSADGQAWRFLGAALGSLGDGPGALSAFSHAVALDPDVASNHYNLGVARNVAGDIDGARASLRRALSLDPGYAQASDYLLQIPPSPASPVYEPSVYAPPARSEAAPGIGRALLAIFLATLAAGIGVALWVTFIIVTKFNIAFIAIGIGWLTGFAAVKGYGQGGKTPAVIAAVVAGLFIGGWTLFDILLSVKGEGGLGASWSVIFNVLCLFWGVQRAYQTPLTLR